MLIFLISLAVIMGIASCVQGATNGALSGRIGLPSAVAVTPTRALDAALLVLGAVLVLWPKLQGGLPS